MLYEDLKQAKYNYLDAIKFIDSINCTNAIFTDRLFNQLLFIDLTKPQFKEVYNQLRLSKRRAVRLQIVKGLIPLFIEEGRMMFHYKYNEITYIFSRPINLNKIPFTITNINKFHIQQQLLNM